MCFIDKFVCGFCHKRARIYGVSFSGSRQMNKKIIIYKKNIFCSLIQAKSTNLQIKQKNCFRYNVLIIPSIDNIMSPHLCSGFFLFGKIKPFRTTNHPVIDNTRAES